MTVVPLLALALGSPQEVVDLPVDDKSLCTEFEEVLRVADELTTVSSMGFDATGTLRIGDTNGVFRVIVVPPDGDRFEFGRQGEGPGEFGTVVEMVALANGHAIVPDLKRDVFHEFLPDGRFARQVRMGDLADRANTTLRADRGGGILGQFRSRNPLEEVDSATLARTRRTVEGPREVVRVDLDGDVAETSRFAAGWAPPRSSFTVNSTMSFSDGRFTTESSIARVAFLPRLLWDALPDGGLAMSDSSAYAIRILDASGNVVRVLRRPLPRRPITAAFRRSYRLRELESLGAKMAEMRSGPEDQIALIEDLLRETEESERGAIEDMEFADEVPQVDDLLTAWDGTIWVRRPPDSEFPFDLSANPDGHNLQEALQKSQANRPPAPVDMLTPDGAYVGTVRELRWPAALGPGNRAAYIEVDEFGIPTVLVGRLSVSSCPVG